MQGSRVGMSRNASMLSVVAAMVLFSVLSVVTVAFAEKRDGGGPGPKTTVGTSTTGTACPTTDTSTTGTTTRPGSTVGTTTGATGTTGATTRPATGTTATPGTGVTVGTVTVGTTTGATGTTGATTRTTSGPTTTLGTSTVGGTTVGTTTGATSTTGPCIPGDGGDQEKVCVLHQKGGGKNHHWVRDLEDLHLGDKVVKDKFCKHKKNGKHKDDDDKGYTENKRGR